MSGHDEGAVRRLFDHAVALEPQARAQLLEDTRHTDPALCEEIESLLRFHVRDGLLDRPPMPPPLPVGAPARIGAYRIESELGRGGMGVVYEARQQTPQRRVALKVLRPEIVSEGILRRFAREAEVLGLFHHPGIAQVYEAGEARDDSGVMRTFIAMELVTGPPLTDFARREKLCVPDRLRLLAQVADAVDHAHRRGVIHRDLKPGNILVEATSDERRATSQAADASRVTRDSPLPKILDFGIARLAGPNVAVTAETMAGQVVGTLAYMSPEQAGGDPHRVDTRSDVYSLGAILYELLGGRPPIDLTGTSLTQAVTAIQQIEPKLLGQIDPSLRGDVEAIAAKALEKDPSRRYSSAAELAADIRRHLADEPVLAHAQTTWYQVRKFARRNRGLVAAVALVALALTVGVVGTSWQWWQATHERERATLQAQRATETAAFLRRMLKSATPEGSGGREVTVRQLLDTAADELAAGAQSINPLVAADTHQVLAEAYFALTEFAKAEDHARLAHDAAAGALGEGSEPALQAVAVRALSLANLSRGGEGLAIAIPAVELAGAALPPDHPVAIELVQSIAGCYVRKAVLDAEEGEKWAREAVAMSQRQFGDDHDRTAHSMLTLAYVLGHSRNDAKIKEAIELDRRVLEIRQRRFGPEHPRTLVTAKDLGRLLYRVRDFEGSAAVLEPHLPMARRVLGPNHMVTLSVETGLAEALEQLGKFEDTLPLLEHAHSYLKATQGTHSVEAMLTRDQYARMLVSTGRCDQAAVLIEEQEAAKAVYGEGHLEPAISLLRFRLAACRHDVPMMERLAERLRGTTFEEQSRKMLEDARQATHEVGRNER